MCVTMILRSVESDGVTNDVPRKEGSLTDQNNRCLHKKFSSPHWNDLFTYLLECSPPLSEEDDFRTTFADLK